jgi:hypothetical protein
VLTLAYIDLIVKRLATQQTPHILGDLQANGFEA